MMFSPAKSPSPSSRTWLMTWLWRTFPKSFRASSQRRARAAGIGGLALVAGRAGREKERSAGVLAELVDQPAEAAGGITQASGGLFGGQAFDEEGAEGLVLALGGVGRGEDVLGECSVCF